MRDISTAILDIRTLGLWSCHDVEPKRVSLVPFKPLRFFALVHLSSLLVLPSFSPILLIFGLPQALRFFNATALLQLALFYKVAELFLKMLLLSYSRVPFVVPVRLSR